jgi:hypothetical protein
VRQAHHDALPSRGAFGEEAEGGFRAAFMRLIRIISWFLLMMSSYPPGVQVPDVLGVVTDAHDERGEVGVVVVRA